MVGPGGRGPRSRGCSPREGAAVIIGDILDEDGLKLEAEIRETGGRATYVHLDVTQADQWESAVSRAVSEYGKLDILVNNAGITGMEGGGSPASAKIDATDTAQWDRILDVNGKGGVLGHQGRHPRHAGSGAAVPSSTFPRWPAWSPSARAAGRSASYAASKGAVRLLTKSTAVQYGPENIRCNSVHPGFIVTPMTQPFLDMPGGREWGLTQGALNRLGTPEDIANGVLFLASDESSFMTGSEMVIDGGWTAQ